MDREVVGDFLAMDIRQALHVLGEITTDDLLASIFGKYLYRKVTSQNNPISWLLVSGSGFVEIGVYRRSSQFQRPKILTKLLPNHNHDCPYPQIKDLCNVPALRDFDSFGRAE